jgi:hypothetical protein
LHVSNNISCILSGRPIPSWTCQINIIHCHLWLSPRLHFPAVAILTNSLILFSIIVYFWKMLKKKQELGTIFKTLQLLYLRVCSKIIRGVNIRGFLLLHVKCPCTKIHSTPGIRREKSNILFFVFCTFSTVIPITFFEFASLMGLLLYSSWSRLWLSIKALVV